MATTTKLPSETELHRLTGLVVELHPKSSEAWSRAKVRKADGTTAWVTAKFGLSLNETLDANCVFNQKFRSYDVVNLIDADGKVTNTVVVLRIVQELAGVGNVKANRLSEQFPDLYETLTKEPAKIAEACGVDVQEVARVAALLDGENATLTRVSALLNYGYPGAIAKRVAKNDRAWKIALTSPYELIRLVEGLGWLTADEVGKKNKIALDDPTRVAAGIDHYYRNEVTRDGHTQVTLDQLLTPKALPQLLGIARDKIKAGIDTTLIPLDSGYYTNEQHHRNARTIAGFFCGDQE